MMDKMRLKRRAFTKPPTTKPGTRFATNKTIRALMTKLKSPRVRMVIGSVRIKIIGFMMALTIPKTTETIIAVTNESSLTPGNR